MGWHSGNTIPVQQLQKLPPKLGIPHFHRGLVSNGIVSDLQRVCMKTDQAHIGPLQISVA
jgi:hypothetical protein